MKDENRYHIKKETTQSVEDRIGQATVRELQVWANDPNCIETELCAQEIARRQGKRDTERQAPKAVEDRRPNEQWPRTEVSVDAKYIASRIVMHLWIIFIVLPIVCFVLYEIITAR